jgi:hypothetical protein
MNFQGPELISVMLLSVAGLEYTAGNADCHSPLQDRATIAKTVFVQKKIILH